MRDSVDSYLTAYTHEGSDPVGYPYGQIPEYSTDNIPMAETAYGATFGELGHRRHRHGSRWWGPGPGWWGGWGYWPWYQPFEVAGSIVQSEPVILDDSGEPQRDDKSSKSLSSFVLKRLHDVAQGLPPAERRMFLVEIKDPSFVAYIGRFLNVADPVGAIMDDALKAIANEFNPRSYPMTRGYWKHLRDVSKKLTVDIATMIDKQVEGMPLERKLAVYEKFREAGLSGGGGLGWIDSLVSTIAGAAGGLMSAKIQSSAQKDIAKIQTQAATKQADLQMKMAQAQMAMQQAQMAPGMPGAPRYTAPGAEAKVLGLPVWAAALTGVGILGIGFFALTRK